VQSHKTAAMAPPAQPCPPTGPRRARRRRPKVLSCPRAPEIPQCTAHQSGTNASQRGVASPNGARLSPSRSPARAATGVETTQPVLRSSPHWACRDPNRDHDIGPPNHCRHGTGTTCCNSFFWPWTLAPAPLVQNVLAQCDPGLVVKAVASGPAQGPPPWSTTLMRALRGETPNWRRQGRFSVQDGAQHRPLFSRRGLAARKRSMSCVSHRRLEQTVRAPAGVGDPRWLSDLSLACEGNWQKSILLEVDPVRARHP